jgi:hypothetical protein
MALATIIVVLAVIGGPLLQRASMIITQSVSGEAESFKRNEGSLTSIFQAGIDVQSGSPIPTPLGPNPLKQVDTTMFAVGTEWMLMNCTGYPGEVCSEQTSSGATELIQLTVRYAAAAKDNCNGFFVSTTCNITEAVVK